MDKKDTLRIIDTIHQRSGDVQFRMAIQHLFDTGHQNFNEANVEEAKETIRRNSSRTPILTPDFQCELLDCCLELSRLPIWDVLLYVKSFLGMEGDDWPLLERAEQSLCRWSNILAPQSWRDACANADLREEILCEMVNRRRGAYTFAEIESAIRIVVEDE